MVVVGGQYNARQLSVRYRPMALIYSSKEKSYFIERRSYLNSGKRTEMTRSTGRPNPIPVTSRQSDASMVRQFTGPTGLWSDGSLVRQLIGPTVNWVRIMKMYINMSGKQLILSKVKLVRLKNVRDNKGKPVYRSEMFLVLLPSPHPPPLPTLPSTRVICPTPRVR